MAWTTADLTAVEDAIRGILDGKTVSFGGKTVSYESLAELRSLRKEIAGELADEDEDGGGGCVFTPVMRGN
jgi:hypothetical protein